MKFKIASLFMLAALLLLSLGVAAAQDQQMSKDEWQKQITDQTATLENLNAQAKALDSTIAAMQAKSTSLDADYRKCIDDLYALVGSDAQKAEAFRAEIEAAENKADELSKLSDADLLARSNEVNDLAAKVKSMWENKLSLIPEFWDRLTALNDKVKSLQNTLTNQVKIYTVGTWARNRDCLWNISKKKDIYNNAWMWPKIWQGNRDQIKDPDVIRQGQKLKIPKGNELTADEKAAAKKYYAKKAGK